MSRFKVKRTVVDQALMPDSIVVNPREAQVGDQWVRTFFASDYPQELHAAWLQKLMTNRGLVDVSLHITPVPSDEVSAHLHSQRGKLESTLRFDDKHGKVTDAAVKVASIDAEALALELARGSSRVFRVGLYVTVRADSLEELNAESTRVRDAARGMLIQLQPATYRTQQGWVTTLPLGLDELAMERTFTTEALAAAFPFASAELPTFDGVLYGKTRRSEGLVRWDRFAQRNYNLVVLAASGAGKSYFVKLETLEWMLEGVGASVIDREGEWARLSAAVGGLRIALGTRGVRLNPFDLGAADPEDEQGPLTERALFLHTLIEVLLRDELSSSATAALDRAVVETYARAGITGDPATHRRPAPVLSDLVAALRSAGSAPAQKLADDLYPFVEGMFRGLFDGPTSVREHGAPLTVYDVRRVPERLMAVAHLLVMDRILQRFDRQHDTEQRRHLLVIEEIWELMKDPRGAAFVNTFSRKARKRHVGVTSVTQQANDLLGTPMGRAVVDNADTQILLGQSRQAIAEVATHFGLSDGERRWLTGCKEGEGILIADTDRVAFRSVAAPDVHPLITTNPKEVAELEEAAKAAEALEEAS